MKIRNLILAPVSWLYGLGLEIRHLLYDEHLLPSHEVKVATICVGNLAVGGTGKTPHVELLVRMLKDQYKIAVLSRGYGRKTHGFMFADERSTALTIGDEPQQIHRKFPDVPLAVCENRVRGIKQLKRMVPDLQVVILDDAMQHRSLRCGLTILLTAQDNLFIDDHLLPLGKLRDLPKRHLAAQAVIITKCPEDFKPIDKRVIDNRLHLAAYQQLYFSKIAYEELDLEEGKSVLVLSGIANPKEFYNHVKASYPKAKLMAFRDHHRFNKKDIAQIDEAAGKCDYVLTTEKDYERLLMTDLPKRLGEKLKVVGIRAELGEDLKALEKQVRREIER